MNESGGSENNHIKLCGGRSSSAPARSPATLKDSISFSASVRVLLPSISPARPGSGAATLFEFSSGEGRQTGWVGGAIGELILNPIARREDPTSWFMFARL